MNPIPLVVRAEPREGHRLWLQFDHGVEGVVRIADAIAFDGVFAPLRDVAFFAAVRVDPDAGTVVWPNGADLDPVVLHARITGVPIDAPGHASSTDPPVR